MSILDYIFKPSPDHVPFSEQCIWAFGKYPSKVFDKVEKIYCHRGYYGDSFYEYLYNDKYLVIFGGLSLQYLNVYLVDDAFQYTKDQYVNIYDDFCYPLIIQLANIHIDGPWITDLKALFDTKGVKQAVLKERENEIKRKAEIERREQSRKQCCEMKRNSVLDNYKSK